MRNQPEVAHFYYTDESYILPGINWVTLGGTKTFNDSNLEVSQRDREHILNCCYEILPSLKVFGLNKMDESQNMYIFHIDLLLLFIHFPNTLCYHVIFHSQNNEEIADMVGLRPHRSPVRVEAERLQVPVSPGQYASCWLVHNYGHGGQGVNLSWGTAREATRLIQQCLTSDLSKSKL